MVISMADPSLPDATLAFLIVFSNDPHRHYLSYSMNRVFSPVPKETPTTTAGTRPAGLLVTFTHPPFPFCWIIAVLTHDRARTGACNRMTRAQDFQFSARVPKSIRDFCLPQD